MAPLNGTGLLADDLFLMAHDSVSGRAHLHPRAVAIGLAAALLAELALDRRIAVGCGAGPLVVVDRTPPRDALVHAVLDQVLREPAGHGVREWLGFLARTAPNGVAERLYRAGLVVREQPRRRRRGSQWVPADWNVAAMPASRLRNRLQCYERLDGYDTVLAWLALSVGLGPDLLWDAPQRGRQHLEYALSTMDGLLRELVVQTQAAVAAASATASQRA